jgi:hypothetical protein
MFFGSRISINQKWSSLFNPAAQSDCLTSDFAANRLKIYKQSFRKNPISRENPLKGPNVSDRSDFHDFYTMKVKILINK